MSIAVPGLPSAPPLGAPAAMRAAYYQLQVSHQQAVTTDQPAQIDPYEMLLNRYANQWAQYTNPTANSVNGSIPALPSPPPSNINNTQLTASYAHLKYLYQQAQATRQPSQIAAYTFALQDYESLFNYYQPRSTAPSTYVTPTQVQASISATNTAIAANSKTMTSYPTPKSTPATSSHPSNVAVTSRPTVAPSSTLPNPTIISHPVSSPGEIHSAVTSPSWSASSLTTTQWAIILAVVGAAILLLVLTLG